MREKELENYPQKNTGAQSTPEAIATRAVAFISSHSFPFIDMTLQLSQRLEKKNTEVEKKVNL